MNILIVDDEEPIRTLIAFNCKKEGWQTSEAASGAEVIVLAVKKPDIIILDLMLPDISGLEVCRILKSNPQTQKIPIIMVTAKTEDSDIVQGLELGADDYVTKPFSLKVLTARIKSVLRRAESENSVQSKENVIEMHDFRIDRKRHEIFINGVKNEFSVTEFSLLDFLASHSGQAFSRQQIISGTKGSDYPVTDRAIDVQILGIRRKLGDGDGKIIETLRGVGYRLSEVDEK